MARQRFSTCITLVLVCPMLFAGASQAQDAAMGQRLFLQCRACHTVGAHDPDTVGPNLYGIMGAAAASRSGYAYSAALRASKLTWNRPTMDAWLIRPTALVPGTRMAFAGIASPKPRRDIIAYLTRLKPAR